MVTPRDLGPQPVVVRRSRMSWEDRATVQAWLKAAGSPRTEIISFAQVDGPPDDWFDLLVFDVETKRMVEHVKAADAVACWARVVRTVRGEVQVCRACWSIHEDMVFGPFAILRSGSREAAHAAREWSEALGARIAAAEGKLGAARG